MFSCRNKKKKYDLVEKESASVLQAGWFSIINIHGIVAFPEPNQMNPGPAKS